MCIFDPEGQCYILEMLEVSYKEFIQPVSGNLRMLTGLTHSPRLMQA